MEMKTRLLYAALSCIAIWVPLGFAFGWAQAAVAGIMWGATVMLLTHGAQRDGGKGG